MPNKYFNAQGQPSFRAKLTSAIIRNLHAATSKAFDLLPDPNPDSDKPGFVGATLTNAKLSNVEVRGGTIGEVGPNSMDHVIGMTIAAGRGGAVMSQASPIGFVHLALMNGPPTDPPTFAGGALVLDQTNNRIYCWSSGQWRYVQLIT